MLSLIVSVSALEKRTRSRYVNTMMLDDMGETCKRILTWKFGAVMKWKYPIEIIVIMMMNNENSFGQNSKKNGKEAGHSTTLTCVVICHIKSHNSWTICNRRYGCVQVHTYLSYVRPTTESFFQLTEAKFTTNKHHNWDGLRMPLPLHPTPPVVPETGGNIENQTWGHFAGNLFISNRVQLETPHWVIHVMSRAHTASSLLRWCK